MPRAIFARTSAEIGLARIAKAPGARHSRCDRPPFLIALRRPFGARLRGARLIGEIWPRKHQRGSFAAIISRLFLGQGRIEVYGLGPNPGDRGATETASPGRNRALKSCGEGAARRPARRQAGRRRARPTAGLRGGRFHSRRMMGWPLGVEGPSTPFPAGPRCGDRPGRRRADRPADHLQDLPAARGVAKPPHRRAPQGRRVAFGRSGTATSSRFSGPRVRSEGAGRSSRPEGRRAIL